MTVNLEPTDFAEYFRTVHRCEPFPWQQALVNRLADSNKWPRVLDLPTGSGKTAALDAAVFHLALCTNAPAKAALRIVLVVDRRLVVDDGFARAQKIAKALSDSLHEKLTRCGIVAEVAQRLKRLAGKHGPPLVAQRLRGGVPLEHDWARTPTQPTILCSTVDQVGSRLLFRGYGVSDRMKPVHAGLLGTDSLILLDEVHLAEPFRQTLDAVCMLGRAETKVALLSATPGSKTEGSLALSDEDKRDPELSKRLLVRKQAALRPPVRGDVRAVAKTFACEAREMADRLRERGVHPAAVGIVVNRVALARDIFTVLDDDNLTDAVLMIGRSRGVDRDSIAKSLAPFRTGERKRAEAKPLFVVATQCLEVGVDLDLDGLVTQAASLDALRQRFGRLNRAARLVDAEGAIIALSEDIEKKGDDPVYGNRIRLTWDALKAIAEGDTVDFGVEALPERLKEIELDPDQLAPDRPDAPVLMPAYLYLWSQTSPPPAADPDVGLFLHGAERSAAGVSIVWRSDISKADLAGETGVNLKQVIRLLPPRANEAVELPLWVARAWLHHAEGGRADISDVPERELETRSARPPQASKCAFRWSGHDDPYTRVVSANDLRPGDLLVVPSDYGGCDSFGWAPESSSRVVDVANQAAKPYWGQRCAVRIAPDLVRLGGQGQRISDLLIDENINGSDLVDHLIAALPSEVSEDETQAGPLFGDVRMALDALRLAKGRIDTHFPYADGSKGGAILVAERGIPELHDSSVHAPTTEDDSASYTSSRPVGLDEHGNHVAEFASRFAEVLDLDDKVRADLRLAAYLHDAGKADPRFQAMLAGGDPWNLPDGRPLAKSCHSWSPQAWTRARLPRGWRHEALSVQMARTHPNFTTAHDPALVLWLIGSHHGLGRPFFNFLDPAPEPPLPCLDVANWRLPEDESGPQSLGFDFGGADWPSLFEQLKRCYGIWGLAYLEAILRLADHRASEEESAS